MFAQLDLIEADFYPVSKYEYVIDEKGNAVQYSKPLLETPYNLANPPEGINYHYFGGATQTEYEYPKSKIIILKDITITELTLQNVTALINSNLTIEKEPSTIEEALSIIKAQNFKLIYYHKNNTDEK